MASSANLSHRLQYSGSSLLHSDATAAIVASMGFEVAYSQQDSILKVLLYLKFIDFLVKLSRLGMLSLYFDKVIEIEGMFRRIETTLSECVPICPGEEVVTSSPDVVFCVASSYFQIRFQELLGDFELILHLDRKT